MGSIKKTILSLSVAVAITYLFCVVPITANARGWRPPHPGDRDGRAVPELSIGAASGAAIILVGGTLVILGRRRRNKDKNKSSRKPE